jgi:DNA-directed RNA polymerase subunit RPC12/RpoP
MSKSASLPPRYSTRPDPDEPWRYGCPDCGNPQLNEYAHAGDERHFLCADCGHRVREDELVDRTGGYR